MKAYGPHTTLRKQTGWWWIKDEKQHVLQYMCYQISVLREFEVASPYSWTCPRIKAQSGSDSEHLDFSNRAEQTDSTLSSDISSHFSEHFKNNSIAKYYKLKYNGPHYRSSRFVRRILRPGLSHQAKEIRYLIEGYSSSTWNLKSFNNQENLTFRSHGRSSWPKTLALADWKPSLHWQI